MQNPQMKAHVTSNFSTTKSDSFFSRYFGFFMQKMLSEMSSGLTEIRTGADAGGLAILRLAVLTRRAYLGCAAQSCEQQQ